MMRTLIDGIRFPIRIPVLPEVVYTDVSIILYLASGFRLPFQPITDQQSLETDKRQVELPSPGEDALPPLLLIEVHRFGLLCSD